MPRSEEAEHWFNAVYAAIQHIPPGKVTCYSHIAYLLGEPQRARQVGVCLKYLPAPDSGQFFNAANVPWQRVVNSRGMISKREPGGAERQAEVLRDEGVQVTADAMGELYIDFESCGWFPLELDDI
ncbi:MGMT family [Aspergillus sp. HF37]|nr:MGMT family [Aspergillus sp. HF37]